MIEHQFTCADAAGETHHYSCNRHRGQEGMPIALKLSALLVEPLVTALGPLVLEAVASGGKEGLKKILDADLLAEIDFEKVASTARTMLASIPPALVYSMLRYTNRDDKPLMGQDGQPTIHFDTAYQGNYLEIVSALWEVGQYNAFFPGLGALASVGEKARSVAQGTGASIN